MIANLRHLCATVVAALLTTGLVVSAAAQGVHVIVSPASLTLPPDSTFVMELRVPEAGSAFNAFDAVVSFDTTAFTFLPTSPTSLQQGSAMTGVCGSTFHIFSYAPGSDSMSISLSLLCPHQSLTGPGQLYKLRFRSRSGSHDTWIHIRSAIFYAAGFYVTPIVAEDAHVIVVDAASVPLSGHAGAVLRVRADPNPARGMVRLTLEGRAEGGQQLEIHDVLGRTVRTLALSAGTGSARWDGRDAAGRALPPGLYVVTWRAQDALARGLVTLLR